MSRRIGSPLFVLMCVVALASVLRFYDITGAPPGFYADEAAFGYNADLVLHTGRDEHGAFMPVFFESFGEYKLPAYVYAQVPVIAALGLSELSVRLTTAVFGVLTVVAAFLLTRSLFRQNLVALLAAAILAISPWHIFYSRTGLGDIATHLFFITAALWLFMEGTKRPILWIASAVAFALGLLSYRAAWVLTPLILAVLLVLYRREIVTHWRYAVVGSCIVIIVGAVIGWHLLSTSGDRAEDQWIIGMDLGVWGTFTRLLNQYVMHLTPGFLFSEDRANLRHVVPGGGWVYYWQAPFLMIGAAALAYRPSKQKLLVLALVLLYPLPAAATKTSPESNRTIIGAVMLSVVTAYGLSIAGQALGALSGASWSKRGIELPALLTVATAGVAIVACVSFLRTYHGDYKAEAAGYFSCSVARARLSSGCGRIRAITIRLCLCSMVMAPSASRTSSCGFMAAIAAC